MTFVLLDQENGLPSPKTRPMRKKALTQVIELQERAYQIALKKKEKPSIACFAMRSWCALQEERRKLEMRPLPKPVDVSKLPSKLARARQLRPASDLEELPPVAPELHAKPASAQVPKPLP